MYGNTLTRTTHALYQMLMRPKDGLRWIRDRLRPLSPIQQRIPWISYPCVDYLVKEVKPSNVFEFGGGGSTMFFLKAGSRVTTVENSTEWANRVVEAAIESKMADRLTMKVVPQDESPKDFEHQAALDEYKNAVDSGETFDVVLVDGVDGEISFRIECLRNSLPHLRPGGILILDDAWRQSYSPVPQLLKDFQRKEFWGLGPGRWGVTKTDVYIKPR